MDDKDLKIFASKFKSMNELFDIESGLQVIAGPCAIENVEQMEQTAKLMVKRNMKFIRGGAFKPRTSPYDFQGLGLDGLKILKYIGDKYNLLTVSEVMDPRDIEKSHEYIDLIQIGSRNMANFSLLKEIGRSNYPVLLKRGMMSTYKEFMYAAEYILYNGNFNIILCERGIRTFEVATRNTLDIATIALIKQNSSVPIIADLSHSLGRKDIIIPILKSLLALNINGIMVEVHPTPSRAQSDSQQQLDFNEFEEVLDVIQKYNNI